ncbi:MAG: hypothetical protein WCC39_00710 [Telluria sp.]
MKFDLVRPALILASSVVLASCGGGGGKETYPVKVTVAGVQYPGLILTTNGQELPIPVPAKAGDPVVLTFPNGLDYGTYYNVIPKGGTAAGGGSEPAHQNCVTGSVPREYGTAGQTASLESARTPAIEVYYNCSILAYPVGGNITGLTSDTATVTLINGSNSQVTITGSTTVTPVPFTMPNNVPYATTYGVTVLTQPTGFTCTVTNGTGTIDDAAETAGKVSNIAVTCVPNT